MTTSLIATAILLHRKGLNLELLHQRASFIYDEIVARGGLIQLNIRPTVKIVEMSASYLKDFVVVKKGIYSPHTADKYGSKSIMMLAYYRNNLTQFFINESEIVCSIIGFGTDRLS